MLVRVVSTLFDLYLLGLIVYAIASWAEHPVAFRIRAALAPFYRPFLDPIQRMMRSLQGGPGAVDFSPLILGILIVVVRGLVEQILFRALYG
jgi:uncharacterized protein YggT (Ycf19 family)